MEEAKVSTLQRLGVSELEVLGAQSNLAGTYLQLGRFEEALRMRQAIYSGRLKLSGDEHINTLREAICYGNALTTSSRFEEARSLLRKTMPVARRVLGPSHEYWFRMKANYARALYLDDAATLDDLHEAVTTLAETATIARRVLGGAHPLTSGIESNLKLARRRENKFTI